MPSLTQDPRWSAGYETGYQAALDEVQRTLGLMSTQERRHAESPTADQDPDQVAEPPSAGLGEMDSLDTTPVAMRDHTRRPEPYSASSLTFNDMFPAPVPTSS